MRVEALRRWDAAHSYSSLACTFFLLLLCLTGLPLIFSDDLAPAPPAIAESGRAPLPLDAIVAKVRGGDPSAYVQFLFFGDEPGTVGVGVADRPNAGLDIVRRLYLDRYTGKPVMETPPPSGPLEFVRSLHTELLSGAGGELVLALVAACFLVSLVTGIVIYAPFAKDRAFAAVRRNAPVPRWLDLHNVIGITLAAWMLVVGATGLMNALEKPLFGAWQGETMPRLLAPYKGQPFPAHLASVDKALASALAAAPGMRPTSIGYPYSPYGSPRHFLIWLKGATPLTEHFFTVVLVDSATGELSAVARLPWYLRLLEISRPLHFGDYGGLPLKLLWVALDLGAILILASGLYLWLKRR
jgi:uncharacterized iron-regulated membrane protein